MRTIILICLIFLMGCPDSKRRTILEPEVNENTETTGEILPKEEEEKEEEEEEEGEGEGEEEEEEENIEISEVEWEPVPGTDYDTVVSNCKILHKKYYKLAREYLKDLGTLKWQGELTLFVDDYNAGPYHDGFAFYINVDGDAGKKIRAISEKKDKFRGFEKKFVTFELKLTKDCHYLKGTLLSIN